MKSLSDRDIVGARGPRNSVDPLRPWHFLTEPEFSASGRVEDVSTIFLTNRECPYKCLMCDLWKNTTTDTVPQGAVLQQIEYALQRLPPAPHIKLYNSGNFFDAKAIPSADLPAIAQRVSGFQTVIVENHPRMCGPACAEFQQLCGTQLEVALGLETSHAETLATLNKRMTTEDFSRACDLLLKASIRLRTFVLLRPPGVTEEQGIEQAVESIRFAFSCGVSCCSVIPVRPGNGILEQMELSGQFQRPRLDSLERVMEETLSWGRGRVFVDLWDIQSAVSCPQCSQQRIDRLHAANLTQQLGPPIDCEHCRAGLSRRNA